MAGDGRAEAWAVVAAVVLGAATLAEFALYTHLTLGSSDRAPWDATLPAHIVRTRHVWPRAASAAFLALAALQTALLFFLGRSARPKAGRFALVAACCVAVVISVAALRAPYLTSNDAYAYIGYAKLPTSAPYAPADSRLPKPFAVVNEVWPGPLLPVYGPLDLAIYRAAVGPQATLGGALVAARFVGFASLIALAALIFGLTRRAELVTLVILNPGLYEQTVVDAHNDLLAVDLILAGMLLGRKHPLAGSLVAATSGFVKINFAAFAAAFTARNAPLSKCATAYGAAIAFVAVGSLALGGSAYWHALTDVAQQYGAPHRSLQSVAAIATHLVLAAFAILSIALSVAGAAVPWSFAWSFAGLAVAVYPNYLVWGLPCALADVRGVRAFLALLPIPSLTCDFIFPGSGELTFAVISFALVFELVRFTRARCSSGG